MKDIRDMEGKIIDTRMNDLRIYEGRCPTLRAQRDGVLYVKNHTIYQLTGYETLLLQGFPKEYINISIPGNATVNKLTLSLDEVRKMLESGQKFDKIKDVTTFFGKSYDRQKVIEQNKKNAVRHAYFREYLALQRLAYMFRFDARNGDLKEA